MGGCSVEAHLRRPWHLQITVERRRQEGEQSRAQVLTQILLIGKCKAGMSMRRDNHKNREVLQSEADMAQMCSVGLRAQTLLG